MNFMIAAAAPGDGQALHQIAAATFHDACPPGFSRDLTDAHVARELSPEVFEAWLADPRYRMVFLVDGSTGSRVGYVVLVDDEPIRMLEAVDGFDPARAEGAWFVSKFYVLAEARGTGAARWLMAAVQEFAREHGATGLWLTVNQLNVRANAFYERFGFHTVGSARFPMGDLVHDDHVRLLMFHD